MDKRNLLEAASADRDLEKSRQNMREERRRPGRIEKISSNLISILRGSALVGPAVSDAEPSQNEQLVALSTATRNGCVACRAGAQIFPFTMAFQPIVDLQNNRIDAYEALVRGPGAESAGHVLNQVNSENIYNFDQACRVKAIELAAHLGMDRQLSINFLPNAVYDPHACIQATLKAAARTGFRLDHLTFEILESEAITDTKKLLNIIKEYRKYGFKIALDDFGTGFSGLARLAELRPDVIKIDRTLAKDCDKDSNRLAILSGMIRIGAEIGVKVVIEGVERAEEVEALRSIGTRFIQGFYFARPLFENIARDAEISWLGSKGL
ncbi:MAG: EAL domain-containing protein [Janthinobacterium lividum]